MVFCLPTGNYVVATEDSISMKKLAWSCTVPKLVKPETCLQLSLLLAAIKASGSVILHLK